MIQDVKFGEYGKITFIEGLPMCHICGKTFNKLGAHSWNAHKIPTSEYRDMFGICKNTKMMSVGSRETAKSKWEENKEQQLINLNKGFDKRYVLGDERVTKKRKLCKEHYDKLINAAALMRNKKI